MNTQYKIIFLRNLLEEAVARASNKPDHVYTHKIVTTERNLIVEITYNGEVVYSFHRKCEDLQITYFHLKWIVEQFISGDLIYRGMTQTKSEIKQFKGKW
jgi:hypothetical protein